ncbi:hypothetical protein [Amycolatopsis sp. NPDC058986]|uniref:hypothetical protein n=1 Tax=unclassified Amycolatopsis TaxID=2618356 RepID=UPI00367118C4
MRRFVTKSAASALVVLLAVPGVASAQAPQSVDEKTGPVSFANIASVRIGAGGGQHGGALITETQRSPLSPGQSKLSAERVAVPNNDGEKATLGGHYEIDLGKFSGASASAYPSAIASRDHDVVAALQQSTVPTAAAETNYAFRDTWQGGAKPLDNTVLVFEGARSAVDCTATNRTTATTSVAKLWVRGTDGTLAPVAVPGGGSALELKNLKLGPPGDVQQASKDKTVSDVTISRVTAFDQLVRQDGWRDGDVTAVAGWRVDITTHVRDAQGVNLEDVKTNAVLGGVSCSIPKSFVARAAGGTGTGATGQQQPTVPTQVPAGYVAASAPADGFRVPLGLGLLGGGLAFAALAVVLGRRRRAKAGQE